MAQDEFEEANSALRLSSSQKPAILKIPDEMLVAIAEHAVPRDLLALRGTCERFSKAAHDAFVKAFFTKRNHICTIFGLQTLVDITAQPEFVRHIRDIEIRTVQLPTSRLQVIMPQTRANWEAEHTKLIKTAELPLLTRIFKNLNSHDVVPSVTVTWRVDQQGSCFGLNTMVKVRILTARYASLEFCRSVTLRYLA